MIQLKTTTTSISSEEIAKIYWDKIWKLHGIPQMVLSDRGPQFMSIFIEDLNEGIKNQENAIYSISSSNR